MFVKLNFILSLIVFLTLQAVDAFAPQHRTIDNQLHKQLDTNSLLNTRNNDGIYNAMPTLILKQRKSVGTIQTMSLFGLGGPELLVIGLAVFFVLGPQKIAELGRNAGRAASEYKDIPKEFQKGLEEGETDARSRKAKPMEDVEQNQIKDS